MYLNRHRLRIRLSACWLGCGLLACGVMAQVAAGHEGHDKGQSHAHGQEHVGQFDSIMTTREGGRVLPPRKQEDVFHFVIFGDRTGGIPAGLKVLEQAVVDTNLLDPDLVMTVGDLVQGYNETAEWLQQAREYKGIMNRLQMPWYPVAGNHDIYWRGEGPAPPGHHEANYEQHFGPLWYSFRHKNAGFIVLFSDEGDVKSNQKGFNQGELQMMSQAQLDFLDKALEELSDVDHLFAFLHHPRWIGGRYAGSNWDLVHDKLKSAGNVTAVFAGHIHHMHYVGPKDDIEYYTLGTTGGHLSADIPDAGYLHHLNLVTVRKDRISVAALPVGAVIDPKTFTPEFLEQVSQATSIQPRTDSSPIVLERDGSAAGTLLYTLANPCPHPVEATILFDSVGALSRWHSTLDHQHFELAPGSETEIEFQIGRSAGDVADTTIPTLRTELSYLGESARVRLPNVLTPIPVIPGAVPADYFAGEESRCLSVTEALSAIRVDAKDVHLADGPLTLEAWVRPSELSGYNAIIAKTQRSEFAFFSDEGVPQFDIHLNGRYVTAAAKDKMTPAVWTHLAGVYDGQQVMMFVDGKLVARRSAQGSRTSNDLPLFIGADPDSRGRPTRPFTGLIDEVRLSRSAVYREAFVPERRLSPRDDSVLLLHLDRQIGPFVLDHSSSAAQAIVGPETKLVPVTTNQ